MAADDDGSELLKTKNGVYRRQVSRRATLAPRLLGAHGVNIKIWFTIMGVALNALNERRARVLAERSLSADRSPQVGSQDDRAKSKQPE